jgi:hypothetical protein
MSWGVLAGVAAGVLVLRGVAASHLPIGHAHPQMDPGVTELDALLAARRRRRHVVDLIKVRALRRGLSAYALERKADGLQQSHGVLSSPIVPPLVGRAIPDARSSCLANSLLRCASRRALGAAG